MGSKLHQVLAVEKELAAQSKTILTETVKVFKEPSLFNGFVKTLKMFDSSREDEEASQRTFNNITTDVMSRVNYAIPFLTRHLDCIFQKEATNGIAKASVMIDGTGVLLKDVPAVTLLRMEKELAAYRAVFAKIPTQQAGIDYVLDESMPGAIYKTAEQVKTQKIEKNIEFRVAAKATEQHPAQIKELMINEQVGEYTETKWTGCITSKKKMEIMSKFEILIQAVKIARSKANNAEIVKVDSTKNMLEWIFA